MSETKQKQTVQGVHQAAMRFRTEIARELGLPLSNDENRDYQRFPHVVIQGEVAQRMVELANRQIR